MDIAAVDFPCPSNEHLSSRRRQPLLNENKRMNRELVTTAGQFRGQLGELKELRKGRQSKCCKSKQAGPLAEKRTDESPEALAADPEKPSLKNASRAQVSSPVRLLRPKDSACPSSSKLTHSQPIPNPLIDQSLEIYQPASWIDCISRQSRRIFLREHFIIARIVLPSQDTAESHKGLVQILQ
jgi:hypothetical protein